MRPEKKGGDPAHKVVATNRKAYPDYFVEDRLEVGSPFAGEVKSPGTATRIRDAFVHFAGRVPRHHISVYSPAS
jgi:tmRNA-binding protein